MLEHREVVLPFIHLNGDRAETLVENLSEVYDALNEVDDKLRMCAPNGRNAYQVDGLMEKLVEQHKYRLDLLRELLLSVEEEVQGILDQPGLGTNL